ncbi:MAG: type III pantothenate kinase [Candidatus Obscuribacterales bacterium]|nr:type III pantothenate kinase [Candidatus Obscuribacterales bacterium]
MENKKDIIAIDLGNSRISCGLFRTGVLVETWFHPSNDIEAAGRSINSHKPAFVALCSVVPEAATGLKALLTAHGHKVLTMATGKSNVIKGIYPTMGADRIANAVAAWKLYGRDAGAVVIDMGTATTLTAVDKNGTFQGGFITLGLGKTIAALHEATAQLPMPTLKQYSERQLCVDTDAAILSGTVLGQTGLVEYWVKIARKTLGYSAQVIATGGWSETIARQSTVFDITDPLLTLRGVYLTAEPEAVQAGLD